MRLAAYAACGLLSVAGATAWGGSILVLDRAALRGLTCQSRGPAGRRAGEDTDPGRRALAACGDLERGDVFALASRATPAGFLDADHRSLVRIEP